MTILAEMARVRAISRSSVLLPAPPKALSALRFRGISLFEATTYIFVMIYLQVGCDTINIVCCIYTKVKYCVERAHKYNK